MLRLLLSWVVNAVALMIVANVVRGFQVDSFGVALVAALIIGLVNATVGVLFTILTLPLTIVTLGLFLLIVNALMLKLAAAIMPGFRIIGFLPAFFGAILLTIVQWGLNWLVRF